jgi:hypothetical protein
MPSDKYICGFGTDNHMPVKPVRTEPHWDQCLYSEYNKQVFIHVMLTKISYNEEKVQTEKQ